MSRRGRLDLSIETGQLLCDLLQPLGAPLGVREESVELGPELQMFRTAVCNLLLGALGILAAVWVPAPAGAAQSPPLPSEGSVTYEAGVTCAFEVRLDRLMLSRLFLDGTALAPELLFALEHALVRVAVTTDPQPVRTDPDAVARNNRLPGLEPRSQRERIAHADLRLRGRRVPDR